MENKSTFTEKLSGALKNLATELEELQVQASLGKAEAKDKWDEYQSKLKHALHEAKHDFNHGTGTLGEIRNKIEQLEVQFALGKAEAKEILEDQKKTLKHALHELQTLVAGLKE